ncbi:FG-GAP-like repeat-containing protein [Actinacidiphila bryophytorum]|uniref:FG-GAP-like repeat-containing protein n=1 Tax=Actinacidiphila bryophytorum TaxID=1436133 RepID=UPI002041C2F5|nr:FG-GAP-like repeat-containing protein [Actinacidiphila bryophytorum]
MTFSGGGTGPLLSGVKDGRTLTLSWPTALPVPTLDGNVATYSEILPGVDLQLRAEVEGFSQLIVVKSAQAAQNPALATLRYTMSTVGLSVATDAGTGSVTASDPAGQSVFTSPTPLMWDSTTISSDGGTTATASARVAAEGDGTDPADAFEPPPGAQDAQMPATVSGDTLSIIPDRDLLTGADTQYPVFIDPSWAWGVRQNWTRVYQKYPNNSYWNANEVARVGYENETGGLSRSFFQWDISNIEHAGVISSVFRIKNVWSWSCEDREVQLWQTGPISSKTTWNHQPSKIGSSPLAIATESKGWSSSSCPAGNLEFDLTPKIKDAAAHANSSVTLGLYAANENDTYSWKKFDPKSAVLETKFNNAPSAPTKLGTSPKTNCASGGLIGNTTVSLYATVDDKDAGNLTARFQVFPTGSTTAVVDKTVPAMDHRVVTLSVPDANLPTGSYTWRINATDPMNATSDWSATCKFSVDRTRPGKPPLIDSTVFPSGEAGWPANTGKARTTAAFTLMPNGATDVVRYGWYTDYDPQVNYDEVAAGQNGSASVTPPGYGPHFVYAFSIDAAGNRSDTATYIYYAASLGLRDAPGDLNGDGNNDIWNVDSNGTLLTYAGQGNGQFSAATNGGQAFDDAQVTSRGDWGQDGYNDLVALEPAAVGTAKDLWTYPNNGSGIATGTGTDGGAQPLTVACPAITEPTDDNPDGCATADDHWHDADQIIAPGDLNGDERPDLLVKENNFLWAYYGDGSSKRLDLYGAPVLVGGSDWNKYTVIAPGDLNNDKVPDLLLRDNASGDVYRTYGKQGEKEGVVNPATWGDAASRVKIGSGLTAAAYPVVGSAGDVTGDGIPDVWGRKTNNTMTGWPGVKTGTDLTGLGTAFSIDGITGGARIPAGTVLSSGSSFSSRSNTLTMQSDGNLVVTSKTGQTLWSTGTGGNPGATGLMQPDGNLVVYKADGSTQLWSSNTQGANGYALLQDRGNLVVYNAKGQSLWAAGTEVRNDYNGDGRSDMAAWYSYADTTSGMVTFTGNSDGTIAGPAKSYTSQPGSWNSSKMQFATGDFNGDGRSDMATAYDYGGGVVRLFTALGNATGGFGSPTASWTSKPGGLYLPSMTLHSGDFNGDGRDDLAVWYSYPTGEDTLFTFTANVQGGFNAPFSSWTSANGWNVSESKLTTGDFNGDGRDDIGALYGYTDGHVTMFSFLTVPTGAFHSPLTSWSSTSWGDWNRTYLQSGDFNADGKDDIAAWYDYADGHDSLHTFLSYANGTGGFNNPTQSWNSAAGNFDYSHMKMTAGDYNGDGHDDLAALYGYTDGTNTNRAFTWLGTTTGGFSGSYAGWSSTAWTWSNFHFLNRYN